VISNARIIEGEWPKVDAPAGSVALVNHITYLTREIVPFIKKKLEQAGHRRVLITDIRVSPLPTVPLAPAPGRAAAIAGAIARFPGEQWGWWGLGPDLEVRLRSILEARFDELFTAGPEGFIPRYIAPGREILITWQPLAERRIG
jgi:hypothetical protein